jgi:hypothetical protein
MQTLQDKQSETFLIMPDSESPEHQIDIIISDQFGVTDERSFTALDSNKAKVLTINHDATAGVIVISPSQSYYTPGQEVKINAVAKFPYYFTGWTGDRTAQGSELTLILDQDFELNAGFAQIPDPRLNINFQPETASPVDGYISDAGDVFDLVDSLRYGWRTDIPLNGIQRSSDDVWDQRKLSYIQMQQGTAAGTTWEMELANGSYTIEIGFGDPGNLNHVNSIRLEDTLLLDDDGKDAFDVFLVEDVQITDESLTLVPSGENLKINYLKIAASGTDLNRYLAIKDGTGTGEYPAGTTVEISASPPSGTDVFEWQGDTSIVADYESSTTTVTIPAADAALKATYLPTYALAVQGGTGSGNYKKGSQVEIAAEVPDNRAFVQWIGDIQFLEDPLSPVTVLSMPEKPIEIEAEFESILSLDDKSIKTKIYPNPTSSSATVEFELPQSTMLTIEILDITGKKVNSIERQFSGGKHKVLLEEQLIKGINIIRITSKDYSSNQLLIVQN